MKIMGQIFMNAEMVRVWLGDNDRNNAFEMIKKIDGASSIWPEDGHERWQKWLKSVGPFVDDNCQLSSPEWKRYEDLINRPWSLRVWVLQEIGLASSAIVMCGEDEMDWFPTYAVTITAFP